MNKPTTSLLISSRVTINQVIRHSRVGGNPVARQGWIPACAGMTKVSHVL